MDHAGLIPASFESEGTEGDHNNAKKKECRDVRSQNMAVMRKYQNE